MVTQQTRTLISYDDSSPTSKRDLHLADQLTNYLHRENVKVDICGYDSTGPVNDTYQWLIVIYTPSARRSQVFHTVNDTLSNVVERKMRGVLLVTAKPSEIPPEWTTIRVYNAGKPAEEQRVFESIVEGMHYVKTPFAESKGWARQLKQSQRRSLITPAYAIVLALLIILVGGGSIFAYFNPGLLPDLTPILSKPSSTSMTATALARGRHTPTSTVASTTTPGIADDGQQLYKDITQVKPTIVGFQPDKLHWDVSQANGGIVGCELTNDTYHASSVQSGQYTPCLAEASNWKNFAYQIKLAITGYARGIIFRDDAEGNYYRFSVTNSADGKDNFAVRYCQKSACQENKLTDGQSLEAGSVQVNPGQAVTLTVIAQGSKISLYTNGQPVGKTLVVDGSQDEKINIPPVAGKIGVYAAMLNATTGPTNVTCTDLKVWILK